MIDLQELQNSLSDERVIELVMELGADRYEEKEDCIIFPTICHNEDASDAKMKLYYYKKNKSFHCYTGCSCNFNIFNLFSRRYDLLNKEYNYYHNIILVIAQGIKTGYVDGFYQPYKSNFEKYTKSKPTVKLDSIKDSVLNIYSDFYTPEWIDDGISIEAMKVFNIKYSIPENKIIIPHYNFEGDLIGIRARALNSEDELYAKYMPVTIGDKIYAHPLGYNLYGLNLNKENIERKKLAFVVESEKGVLQYESMFGRENNLCVAVCGSNFSNYQFQLLQKAGARRIIVAFDNEGAFCQEREQYYNKLLKLCKKYASECIMGFIWDSKKLLKLKDSPTDRGKEVFLKLYREGVVWVK